MNGRRDVNYSFSGIKTLKIQKDKHLLNSSSRGKLGEVTTRIIQNSRIMCMRRRRNMEIQLFFMFMWKAFHLVVFVPLLTSRNFTLGYPRLKILEICLEGILSFFSM